MTSESKTIFKRRRSRYTSISNTPLKDQSLSLAAVGFLACIMALPEDWEFNRSWARKRFGIGRDKLNAIIVELRAAGYVDYRQDRKDDGTFGDHVIIFTDEPGQFGDDTGALENRCPENPVTGEPDSSTNKGESTKDIKLQTRAPARATEPQQARAEAEPADSEERRREVGRMMKNLARSLSPIGQSLKAKTNGNVVKDG